MRFVSQQQKEILKTSRGPNESYLKLWNNTKERPCQLQFPVVLQYDGLVSLKNVVSVCLYE